MLPNVTEHGALAFRADVISYRREQISGSNSRAVKRRPAGE
jgi:hypothetical protein